MLARRVAAPVVLASLALAVLALAPPSGSASGSKDVTLTPIKFDAFQARLAKNPNGAKFFVVDAWATNCGPCKENFPHLVQMNERYGPKGIEFISLSMDDPEDSKAIAAAKQFLESKNARFPNFYIDEEFGTGYEKLDINSIPAVFVFGPDGKELKRFTLDDPDNQFTYDDVEKAVQTLLSGKPLPAEKGKGATR